MISRAVIICSALCFSLFVCLPALSQNEASDVPLPIPRPNRPLSPPTQQGAETFTYQAACAVLLDGRAIGKITPPLHDEGCGSQSPYRITAIQSSDNLVKLSAPALFNCGMATAFVEWVTQLDEYMNSKNSSPLASINVGTSYACRRRNNQTTGKISEHGFANALDLTGFELRNGDVIELPEAWSTGGAAQELMKTAHKLACQTFTTVLGPEANPLHADHLHFDMGCHGKTCTYRVCK